jgi:ankyrin repeat protein
MSTQDKISLLVGYVESNNFRKVKQYLKRHDLDPFAPNEDGVSAMEMAIRVGNAPQFLKVLTMIQAKKLLRRALRRREKEPKASRTAPPALKYTPSIVNVPSPEITGRDDGKTCILSLSLML